MGIPHELLTLAIQYSRDAYTRPRSDGEHNRVTSASGFIDREGDRQIVSFTGSESPIDWLGNALIVPVPYRGALAHAGFVIAHQSIWQKLRRQLDPELETIFTGHSLGGAMAELSMLSCKNFKRANLVTFGKPNVFARIFRPTLVGDYVVSVVNGSDVVARIPRAFYGPSDDQDLLYLGNDKIDVWNPSKQYKLKDLRWRELFTDHNLHDLYTDRVNRYMQRTRKQWLRKYSQL